MEEYALTYAGGKTETLYGAVEHTITTDFFTVSQIRMLNTCMLITNRSIRMFVIFYIWIGVAFTLHSPTETCYPAHFERTLVPNVFQPEEST